MDALALLEQRPEPTARRRAGGLHQPEHPPGLCRSAPPPRRLARRPADRGRDAELHDQGRAPASTSTGGGRGVLPEPASPASRASAGERTAPGPRRLPADRRRSTAFRSDGVPLDELAVAFAYTGRCTGWGGVRAPNEVNGTIGCWPTGVDGGVASRDRHPVGRGGVGQTSTMVSAPPTASARPKTRG